MSAAGPAARGGTAYLNLEPGDCHGEGAAVEALVRSGVSRVVVGLRHPLRHLRSRGIGLLRNAGLRVGEWRGERVWESGEGGGVRGEGVGLRGRGSWNTGYSGQHSRVGAGMGRTGEDGGCVSWRAGGRRTRKGDTGGCGWLRKRGRA